MKTSNHFRTWITNKRGSCLTGKLFFSPPHDFCLHVSAGDVSVNTLALTLVYIGFSRTVSCKSTNWGDELPCSLPVLREQAHFSHKLCLSCGDNMQHNHYLYSTIVLTPRKGRIVKIRLYMKPFYVLVGLITFNRNLNYLSNSLLASILSPQ